MTRRSLPLVNLAHFTRLRAQRDHAAAREREVGALRRWYRVENASSDAPTVYIYDEIGYWGVTASDFASDMRSITADKITVRINSPGGECYDGLAIYNTLVQHPAEIAVMIDGLAASAASFVAQAGDTVKIARNADVMIHDASGLCWGNAEEMRKMVEMLDRMSDNIADIYAQRAGGTPEEWRARMRDETYYTGQAAVDVGLADEVYSGKAIASPAEAPTSPEDKAPAKILAQVRWRPAAYDPLQPRGDDGKWSSGLPDGMAGDALMTLDKWAESYPDVEDEAFTDSGLGAVSMSTGEVQLAFNTGDDRRFVIRDSDVDESRVIADGIERAIDAGDTGNSGDADITYGSEDIGHAAYDHASGEVTMTFYGAADANADLQFTLAADDAQAFVDAIRAQADVAEAAVEMCLRSTLTALVTPSEPGASAQVIDDWATMTATLYTIDDRSVGDDDPLAALRKAYA